MQVSSIYSYIAVAIVVVLAILFVVATIKGVIKLALIVAIVVVGLIVFGKITPSELQGISKAGITQITNLAKTSSDKVKIDTSNGYNVSVKIADTWVSTADIASIKATGTGEYTVTVNGKNIEVSDEAVCTVLSYITKDK